MPTVLNYPIHKKLYTISAKRGVRTPDHTKNENRNKIFYPNFKDITKNWMKNSKGK